jgi:glutaminase
MIIRVNGRLVSEFLRNLVSLVRFMPLFLASDVCFSRNRTGITTYAPPLTEQGNSVRGIEFFKKLVTKFQFHNFGNVISSRECGRINPLNNTKSSDRIGKISALYAAAEGDLKELRKILLTGVPATISDYDGRTLLHLAASEGHLNIVKYLLKHHVVDVQCKV